MPICYASQSFFDLTGYATDFVMGRNCRFLQGPETARQQVNVAPVGCAPPAPPRPAPRATPPSSVGARGISVAHHAWPQIMEIRDAIREERACHVCLLNYKASGARGWRPPAADAARQLPSPLGPIPESSASSPDAGTSVTRASLVARWMASGTSRQSTHDTCAHRL